MLYTTKELQIIDTPTADSEVILASLGGKPHVPEDKEESAGEKDPNADASNENADPGGITEEDKWL